METVELYVRIGDLAPCLSTIKLWFEHWECDLGRFELVGAGDHVRIEADFFDAVDAANFRSRFAESEELAA